MKSTKPRNLWFFQIHKIQSTYETHEIKETCEMYEIQKIMKSKIISKTHEI